MKISTLTSAAMLIAASAFSTATLAGGHGGGKYFSKMDTDGNGSLSQAEINQAREARFASMDADGNGHVTLEEFQQAGMKKANKRAERHFGRMDANGDGLVTADELDDRMGKHFDKVDADGNGELSKDELKAAHQKMREHRKDGKKGGHADSDA